jgi:hypothetical protein
LIPDNERYYSGVASRALKMPVEHLALDAYRPYDGWEYRFPQPEPSHDPLLHWETDLFEHCANFSRVVLYGQVADEIFRPSNLFTLLRHDQPLLSARRFLQQHLQAQCFPSVGTGICAHVEKLAANRGGLTTALPKWLKIRISWRASLTERWRIRDHRIRKWNRNDPWTRWLRARRSISLPRSGRTFLTKCDMAFYGVPHGKASISRLRVVLLALVCRICHGRHDKC